MPTPVNTARPCLTPEAAQALDEAVSVARRRGHGQTTSLHAVSALLSLPSSTLQEACACARNCAYSPRLKFRALELCLSVSLDRVPTTQLGDEPPPVSNSLMAAIKRSQANQRRQPENFHLYHQISQQQSTSSISCIKVDLQNLILSILDDPVVSRVFAEAGFRSSEIKLAIVRPLPQVFKFSPRFKGPPLFLCNLSDNQDQCSGPGWRGSFKFPFSGYNEFSSGDDFVRSIGEVLVRNRGKNPLLVGLCAYDTLASFSDTVEKIKDKIFPLELSGLSVIRIENDVIKFVSENCDKGCVDLRFEELDQLVKPQSLGPGLLVNIGDLKAFVSYNNNNNDNDNDNNSSDAVTYVVEKLTRLLQRHGAKIRLIGATASYETYSKFICRFPGIEKDWDVQLFPITSLRTSLPESYPRSRLMESFVPFGGFFPTPSNWNGPLGSSCQSSSRCHMCNEKCEQEVLALSKGGLMVSVADHYQSSLPSWLQMAELGTNKGLDMKTSDNGVALSTKVADLQKKWDSICQRLHHTQPDGAKSHPSQFPTVAGFQLVEDTKEDAEDTKEDAENHSRNNINVLSKGSRSVSVNSGIPIDLQRISKKQLGTGFPVVSEAKIENIVSKQWEKPLKEVLDLGGLASSCSFSNSSIGDGNQTSPTSVTSVTTDLGLRVNSNSTSNELNKPVNQNHTELQQDASGGSISNYLAQSLSSSSPDSGGQFDPSNLKMMIRALTERVGWQDEAVRVISQKIVHCRTTNKTHHGACVRRGIWLNFRGPDKCGKMKVAAALAEVIYGSRESIIFADLSPKDGMIAKHTLIDCQKVNCYEVLFRGKTVVDFVAGELCKKPLSVVFLENVDKADVQAQKSLSHAIRSGKFLDSRGKEVGINNAIFITTSTSKDDKLLDFRKDFSIYSEERILRAKDWSIQISIEQERGAKMGKKLTLSVPTREAISSSIFVNKRKLVGMSQNLEQHNISEMVKRAHTTSTKILLDLNLPAEENDGQSTDDGNSDNDSMPDNSKGWLQDFFDQVDGTVEFKRFDFDALAKRILNEINKSFHKIVGSKCSLDIDSKVMEQLLATAYLSDQNRVVEDWVEHVLSWGFVQVVKRHNLSSHSTVKLVASEPEAILVEEHTAGVHLPLKIIVN